MELKLFENALDFIDTAVEYANVGKEPRNFKYAIVHLYNGIELLLKAKLKACDWRLLFDNYDRANERKMKTGDFKSVGLDMAIDRLGLDCSIEIEEDKKKVLIEMKNIRNRTMHYEFSSTEETVLSIITKVWAFALEFIGRHLSDELSDNERRIISKIRKSILKSEEFLNNRRKEIEPLLKEKCGEDFVSVMDCPECFEMALILSEEIHLCAFCGYGGPYELIMDKWCETFFGYRYTDPKERSIKDVIYLCQECIEMALVQILDEGDVELPDPGWVCFACGSNYAWDELKLCSRCDQPYRADPDGDPFCLDCWAQMISKE